MLDHVGILVADWTRARAFYDAAFAPLGYSMLAEVPVEATGGIRVGGYGKDKPDFWLTENPEPGNGRHYAFEPLRAPRSIHSMPLPLLLEARTMARRACVPNITPVITAPS